MNCPICNKELQPTDAFCPSCGYEIHVLPGNISDAAREYEETREKSYRKTWVALNESHADSQRLEAENSIIQQKFDEKEQELKDIVAQNEKLDNQLKALEEERNRLRSQIEEKQADISERKSTIQKLRDQIRDYLDQRAQSNKEKEEWKTKYDELSKKMSEAQLEIDRLKTELKSNSNSVLLGIVSIKNKATNVLSYLPVYKGENTYGSMADDGQKHHQIKMRVRGDVLKPKMFSVQIDNNTAIVRPIGEISIICDGSPIPVKGKIVMAQQSLFVGDIIEIHVSKI